MRKHLGEVVRTTVQDTLNVLLDAKADRLCGAMIGELDPRRRGCCTNCLDGNVTFEFTPID